MRRCIFRFSCKMAQKRTHSGNFSSENKKLKNNNHHWALGLLDSMNDPDLQVESDDLVVVIKDKYPKAKFHYLILPKESISSVKKLSKDHIELLKHMEEIGRKLVEKEEHRNHTFKFGYHAEASMHRLHMHVISDDMDSPCLKTRRHWNSFNTEFFIDAKVLHEDVKKNGKVTLPSAAEIERFLKLPLACHKCDVKPKNIPTLKSHILTHIGET